MPCKALCPQSSCLLSWALPTPLRVHSLFVSAPALSKALWTPPLPRSCFSSIKHKEPRGIPSSTGVRAQFPVTRLVLPSPLQVPTWP